MDYHKHKQRIRKKQQQKQPKLSKQPSGRRTTRRRTSIRSSRRRRREGVRETTETFAGITGAATSIRSGRGRSYYIFTLELGAKVSFG